MKPRNDWNNRLRAAREYTGMSMDEVGRRVNKSMSTIYRYEKCKLIPDVETASKLAVLYERSLDSIFLPNDLAEKLKVDLRINK